MEHQETDQSQKVQAPNKQTAQAIAELETGNGHKATSVQALMEDLKTGKPVNQEERQNT